MTALRLLTVSHFYEAHGGGIERVAGHLARQLAAQGHDVTWAASDGDAGATAIRTVPLRCVNLIERLTALPMPIPGLQALRRLTEAVRASDAVIVHDSLYLTSIAAMLFARAAGRPVMLIQHIARIPFTNPLLAIAMRVADRIVTVPMLRAAGQVMFISATSRDAFAHVAFRRRPLLMFNGVDSAAFHPSGADARAELGIAAGETVVLFVGRLVRKKGVEIVREIARARPDVRVILAGRGPIDPEAWGLPNVRVVRDRSGASLAALYRAADMLVLPSFGEGYPLVVQEAMACGLSVLCDAGSARADPGAAQWLTGIAVDPDAPAKTAAAFAAAIDAHRHDPAARAAMAAYAARTYSWPAMAARVAQAITVLGAAPAAVGAPIPA